MTHDTNTSKDAASAIIIQALLRVLHPGVVGLIGNHHGEDRGTEAAQAVTAAKAHLATPEATPNLSEIVQVAVFASGGVTQSVIIRPLPPGEVPCIVVDYDDRHDDTGSLSPEDFERKKLGCTREEFDKTAAYIW